MRKVGIYHTHLTEEHTIKPHLFCSPSEDKKNQLIIDLDNLEFKMIFTPDDLKMKFGADTFNYNLPQDLHFGCVLFEKVKQMTVTRSWFKTEYLKQKRKYNYQYVKKSNSQAGQPNHHNFVPALQGRY